MRMVSEAYTSVRSLMPHLELSHFRRPSISDVTPIFTQASCLSAAGGNWVKNLGASKI